MSASKHPVYVYLTEPVESIGLPLSRQTIPTFAHSGFVSETEMEALVQTSEAHQHGGRYLELI